jgi:hypothetical protein
MLDGDWSSDVCSSDLSIVRNKGQKNVRPLAYSGICLSGQVLDFDCRPIGCTTSWTIQGSHPLDPLALHLSDGLDLAGVNIFPMNAEVPLSLVINILVLKVTEQYLIGTDMATVRAANPEKPTSNCNRERIQRACLTRSVRADNQVELWVKGKITVVKALEVRDFQMVYAHGTSLAGEFGESRSMLLQ